MQDKVVMRLAFSNQVYITCGLHGAAYSEWHRHDLPRAIWSVGGKYQARASRSEAGWLHTSCGFKKEAAGSGQYHHNPRFP